MVKSSRDVLLDTTNVVAGAGIAALPLVFLVAPPAPVSWPYIVASVVIHIGYYVALVGAYRAGDLSHGYPIMRGLAPLLVAMGSSAWLGEVPQPSTWAGVLLICGGVLSLGLAGFRWSESRRSTGWALTNAAIIACYTLVDATGVRASGSPEGYVLWMFVLDALLFPLGVLLYKKKILVDYARKYWLRGLASGVGLRDQSVETCEELGGLGEDLGLAIEECQIGRAHV